MQLPDQRSRSAEGHAVSDFSRIPISQDFDFSFERSLKSDDIAHLADLDLIEPETTSWSSARLAPARHT